MSSTYSTSLKIQLMATGENNTTWGTVTNTNLGTALEEAITGSADVAFSNADVTLTLTNTNTTQTARNMRLNLTGTATTGYNLIVPAVEKAYIVNNGTDGAITIKNATGTGIAIPSGRTMWVFNNAVNVVDATNYLSSLALGTALPITSGGTGATTLTGLAYGNGTSAFTAATATQIVSAIGATAVTNATNVTGTVSNTATVNGVTIGYRNIPRSTTSGTATTGDIGKCIAVSAGITIPNSTFSAGDALSIYNDSATAITITAGVATLRLAGTASTGNRTLAARGVATIWFNSATEAIISGAGVN